MTRRVTDGPREEYQQQLDDLRRRTDTEHGPASQPDPNWELRGTESPPAIWGLLDAVMRRPYCRLPRA